MKKGIYTSIAFLLLLFSACKNDVDILDDWKETMVVYGLLNQDSVTYIKVNKAYLGEGNAMQMATVHDSINYGKDVLDVRLEAWEGGTKKSVIQLKEDNTIPKNSGIFSYPNQIIYTFDKAANPLSDKYEYRLVVSNTKTGTTVNAKTPLVEKTGNTGSITYNSGSASFLSFNPTLSNKLICNSFKNGKRYEATLRFFYAERDSLAHTLVQKYIDLPLGVQYANNVNSKSETILFQFPSDNFFTNIANNLEVNPYLYRFPGKTQLLVSIAAEEFSLYMDVYKPSTGVVQEKPSYTNIEGGIGIFSARSTIFKEYAKNNLVPYAVLGISSSAMDSLACGRFTKHLNFAVYKTTPVDTVFPCN